jgi:hypothetical protein
MEQQSMLGESLSNFMGESFSNMTTQFDWAEKLRTKFETDVIPQMDSLFKEADTYASKAEEDRQRGMAIQDVSTAMEAQREAARRKLEGVGGVDPSIVRGQAMENTWGVQTGAVQALAANQAAERTKQEGRDLRDKAIATGSTFLNEANNAYNTGTGSGLAAMNAANQTTQAGVAAGQSALPFYSGANTAASTAAGIVDTSYGRELQYAEDQRAAEAADASGMAGLGRMAGYGLAIPTGGTSLALTHMGQPGATSTTTTNNYAAEGGTVMAPGGPTSDGGALRVSDGEYVVPADVVKKLGTNHFDKMIEKETGRPPPSAKIALPTGGV